MAVGASELAVVVDTLVVIDAVIGSVIVLVVNCSVFVV